MTLRLAVLGFAGAAPLNGACSSYAVSDGESVVLLDCGPGTLERAWRFDLLSKLDAIVISHMHADHVLDLLLFAGELVQEEFAGRRPRLFIPAHIGPTVLGRLDAAFSPQPRRSTRFEEAFDISTYESDEELAIGALKLTFGLTAHTAPCFAIRASDGERSLVYGADGGPSRSLERLAQDTDLLILEATFADDAKTAAAHGHMTARQAGEVAARAGAKNLLLTHLLPGADETFVKLAQETFGGRVELAREGLTYDLQ